MEVRALADAAPHGGDLILTSGFSGLRWGELAALTVGSVDQGRRLLTVRQSAPATTRKVEAPKTRSSARSVVYGEGLDETNTFLSLAARNPSELVFTSPKGAPLHHSNYRKRAWLPALEATGLSFRFHDLRHTYATLLIGGGVPLALVAKMMGHSSPRVTLDVYAGHFGELDQVSAALRF